MALVALAVLAEPALVALVVLVVLVVLPCGRCWWSSDGEASTGRLACLFVKRVQVLQRRLWLSQVVHGQLERRYYPIVECE